MRDRLQIGNVVPRFGNWDYLYVAYFPAVCAVTADDGGFAEGTEAAQSSRRFLRFDDPDVPRFVRRAKDDWQELAPRYFMAVNEITTEVDLLSTLAHAVGKSTHDWVPQKDEIHVIVLIANVWYHDPRPLARVRECYTCLDGTFGSDRDRCFHSVETRLPTQLQLGDVLEHATVSDWAFSSLPAFDRIVFHRRRCPYAANILQTPSAGATNLPSSSTGSAPASPPSLLQLAEDAALHTLLAHPPVCADPVDCVIDASLDNAATETVVLDNVLCFVKFERIFHLGPYEVDYRSGHYVNPTMLETLNQVALAADPLRPGSWCL